MEEKGKDKNPGATLELKEEEKLSAEEVERILKVQAIEKEQDLEKSSETPSILPIKLSKTERRLWIYQSNEIKMMEDQVVAVVRDLGQKIKINLVEQFAEAHGIELGRGGYMFNPQTQEFIEWQPPRQAANWPAMTIPPGKS